MFDRIFTLALAAGLLGLAVSTTIAFVVSPAPYGTRLVQFERVMVKGKRVVVAGDTAQEPRTTQN